MEVSGQLTGFELEDLKFWTVSNLQRPFREDFSLEKSGIIAEKLKSEARHGRTIPVITHDRELIESCCDNFVGVEKRLS